MSKGSYSSRLGAGLAMLEETRIFLDLWQPGMQAADLQRLALESGRFPNVSARRLRNLVGECFALRYLADNGGPAALLKSLLPTLSNREYEQLLFLYTCRAHPILTDFVCEVYWTAYSAGRDVMSNEEARVWVTRANQDGKTTSPWSETSIKNVAGYLTGVCAEYGLLERGQRVSRKILSYRIESRVATVLAYDLHYKGLGDNAVLSHPDWALFGMERDDVLDEMKRLALKGLLIVQSAGGVTRISWPHKTMEELADVLAHG